MGKGEEIPKTNPAEIEAVIARVKQSNIEQRDVELIERLLRTVLVLVKLLERKNISIKKLVSLRWHGVTKRIQSDSDLADVGAWPGLRPSQPKRAKSDDIPKTDPSEIEALIKRLKR